MEPTFSSYQGLLLSSYLAYFFHPTLVQASHPTLVYFFAFSLFNHHGPSWFSQFSNYPGLVFSVRTRSLVSVVGSGFRPDEMLSTSQECRHVGREPS